MGLLPGDDAVSMEQTASLTLNDSGRYEDRWVTLEFDPDSPCIWTQGIERMHVPVRHGEGSSLQLMRIPDAMASRGQISARYVDPTRSVPFGIR